MKRVFCTKMTKRELDSRMNCLRCNPQRHDKDGNLYLSHFDADNKIEVNCTGAVTSWKLDFGNDGRVVVERCMAPLDWFVVVCFAVVCLAVMGLALSGTVSEAVVMMFAGIALLQVLPVYYMGVVNPLRVVTRFVGKYLGATELEG